MAPYFCVECSSESLARYGTTGQLYSLWLCKLHTIEDHDVLCHATVETSTPTQSREIGAMQTVLCKAQLIFTGDATVVRLKVKKKAAYTSMFSGDDCIFLVEQPQRKCQLIGILDFSLAAMICCHRRRHRCNAIIHACLHPKRLLCLHADFSRRCLCIFGPNFSDQVKKKKSDNFLIRFSKFFNQLLLRKAFPLQKR